MEICKTVCPYDCPDACGLLAYRDKGVVVKVAGNPEHPFTRGMLCPKMAHYERTVYSLRRLLTPLRRTGPKGSGQFEPVSWDEALQVIAERWRHIINAYGGEAILPYSFSGTMGMVQHNAYHGLFYRLGASELERTICSAAKNYGWNCVMGHTLHMRPQEAQHSDFIILWGISMLSTNLHFLKDVREAMKRGAQVWCIDTYATETARRADRFIQTRPGSDGALALGVLHCLRRDGLCDEAFIHAYVQGWTELQKDVLPKYTPAYVQEVTGVPAAVVEELAAAYGRAKAPFIRLGAGLSRYTNGAMTVRLIACLPAAIGAWQYTGGGLMMSTSCSTAFDQSVVTKDEWKKPVRRVNMCEIGSALLQTERPIRSLFVYSSNPACTAPDQNQVIAGLSREDLFTVVHERFMTDTARYADIILPATTSLEHDDLYYSYGSYVVGRGKAVIEPLGQCRSNWSVACDLAKAMGIDDPFFHQSEDDLVEALIDSTSSWPVPVDGEALRRGDPVELGLPEGYKLTFGTPSGKIEIRNDEETPTVPDYFPACEEKGEYYFTNGTDPRVLDSSFNERDELTRSRTMVLFMHPDDAARQGFGDGEKIVAWNSRGEALFTLHITNRTAPGQVVSEGLWWIEHCLGDRSVNALTSQRLSDKGRGSTFYNVRVNVKKAQQAVPALGQHKAADKITSDK